MSSKTSDVLNFRSRMMSRLSENSYYHIYNHANGSEDLFQEERNYYFFLKKYDKYISPIAETLAYCLMPNHYHILIRTKETSDVSKTSDLYDENTKIGSKTSNIHCSSLSNSFKNLFQSYTKSYNKLYCRKGSLFHQRFKRKELRKGDDIRAVMRYIHLNPVHHGFCVAPDQWTFNSYSAYLQEAAKTKLAIVEGLAFFENRAHFIQAHQSKLATSQVRESTVSYQHSFRHDQKNPVF